MLLRKSGFGPDGCALIAIYSFIICMASSVLIRTRFGLTLRALGDNAILLRRLGTPVEKYRVLGFAFTNMLAAASGIFNCGQTISYADYWDGAFWYDTDRYWRNSFGTANYSIPIQEITSSSFFGIFCLFDGCYFIFFLRLIHCSVWISILFI